MWDHWTHGQELKLVKRNPHYWQKGKPYLDQVTFRTVDRHDNTRQLQLQGGQAQIDEFPPTGRR